ncbi:MAG: crossover junction endodeoxyribonuclease RuvC [Deltaproteobacteria bacterium]|jgi:crossover junction endodeoxyribonuclease RuvC|nr:crossover junction endodeoxyribonuclease RuvC [Deltaproteobacteria bacterium]MBW2534537.1 crossover junction endodeoxyribonuclease RuvC [Deltaproteobacteria bacterium]
MRVIGIDPGTRSLGWGVVEQRGTRRIHVDHGVIQPPKSGNLADRLYHIDEALRAVLDRVEPEASAVESIFYAKDPQSAAKLGHARGVVLLALRRKGLTVHEYPPARVKRTVVGRGRAGKHQVAQVVAAALGLAEPPPSDAADALAVALTCIASVEFDRALARVKAP